MLPYHTCFGPDWCFGLIKLKYRRSQISSVFELVHVVNTSTQKEINLAQLIEDPILKQTLVQVYNWKSYFETYFRKVPNITRYHHFQFDATKPGLVFIKEFLLAEEKTITIMKNQCTLHFEGMPLVLNPRALQQNVHGICTSISVNMCQTIASKDITCPKPSVPKPKSLEILKHGRIKSDD